MAIRGILWDFDGTIADTTPLILASWQHTYRHYTGADGDVDTILATFGEPLVDSMRAAFPGEDCREVVQVYRDYQEAQDQDQWVLFPKMKEAMAAISEAGYLQAVVTSRMGETCRRALRQHGLDQYVETVISCEDTTAHKPQPEPALICLERVGLAPEEAIMIGDTSYDIGCGQNAGLRSFLVGWSVNRKRALASEFQPDGVIEEPEDILPLLETMK